jgi:hypothetical protein
MNSYALPGWIVDLVSRWWNHGPDVRLLDASWEWQPKCSPGLLLWGLVVLWVIVLVLHRSRRLELPRRWRLALGLLRGAILAVPVLMLLQPTIAGRFERLRPKSLVVLMDRSGSMSVQDGSKSRWESAVSAVLPAVKAAQEAAGADSVRGVPTTQPVDVRFYLFDQDVTAVAGNELQTATQVRTERRTAIGNALRSVRSALAGQVSAGVICLSDGADNASYGGTEPIGVARELGREGIPVQTVLVGNEHPRDLAVSVSVEAPFAYSGDPVPLQVAIAHHGYEGASVAVSVFDGDRPLVTRDVVLPASSQPASERIELTFDATGKKQCRVQVAPLPGELTSANNTAVVDINVIDQPMRVLYIEHWPRWQYRFLRNAFQRDKRFLTRLVLLTEDPSAPQEDRQAVPLPSTAEEFSKFDAIVIGDVARQDLAPQQWQWIHDCVVDGGAGIIFIAGPAHDPADFLEPPTASLLPFQRVTTVSEEEVTAFKPVLTALGRDHPLMRLGSGPDATSTWQQLPAMQWYAGVTELKPGAVVLAERRPESSGEPTPLIVLQRVGRGSVLFVGTDETWKWRYQTGNQYFYGFWARAIQHVGMPHRVGEFRSVRIDTAARTVPRDMPTPVSMAIDSAVGLGGAGGEGKLTLIAERAESGAPPLSFVLRQSPDSPFVYQGELRFPAEGTYRLFAEGHEGQGESTIEVKTTGQFNPELAAPEVNPTLMRQIAQAGGGRYATLDQLPALLSGLDLAPLRFRWTERVVLWDGWTLLLALAALLTVEWVARKLRYLP